MAITELYWQRKTPLATFGEKTNLIFVSTEHGIWCAIDDIFDDIRNDELNMVVLSGTDTGKVELNMLESTGASKNNSYDDLSAALHVVRGDIEEHDGLVVTIDTRKLAFTKETHDTITDLMSNPSAHIMLAVTEGGLEYLHHYISMDTNVVIEIEQSPKVEQNEVISV